MNIKKIENICAAALIVAFFLPWVSMGFISVSGYKMATLGGAATLMFLIPLLAIAVLANDSMNFLDADKSKYLTYATAGIPIIYIVGRLIDLGGDFFSGASIGIYLTLIASIAMILGALGKIKLPE
jgi:hypothetical protein